MNENLDDWGKFEVPQELKEAAHCLLLQDIAKAFPYPTHVPCVGIDHPDYEEAKLYADFMNSIYPEFYAEMVKSILGLDEPGGLG